MHCSLNIQKEQEEQERKAKEAEKEAKKEQTKEKVNEKVNEKVICECGGTYAYKNKVLHFKTAKHIKNMK